MFATATLLHLALVALLSGGAGVGFAVIIQTSPLGRIPYKPFSCRTCCSGWGAILASGLFLQVWLVAPWVAVLPYVTWCVVAFIGIGVAHVLMGIADGRGTAGVADLPAFDVVPFSVGAPPDVDNALGPKA